MAGGVQRLRLLPVRVTPRGHVRALTAIVLGAGYVVDWLNGVYVRFQLIYGYVAVYVRWSTVDVR